MDLLKDFFVSRKAQALFVMLVIITFGKDAGLAADQVENMTNVIVAFIIGRAIHDQAEVKKS